VRVLDRWHDWPWAWKLAALIVALSILPIVVVTIFNESAARRSFVSQAHTRNLQEADNTGRLITRYLRDIVSDVTIVAQTPSTREVLLHPDDPSPLHRLDVTLSSIRNTKEMELLQVLDHDGTIVASTDPSRVRTSRITSPYFLSAIAGQTRVHDPRFVPDDQAVHVHVSAPVRDDDGRVLGAAVGRVSLDELDRLVAGDTDYGGLGEFGLIWDEQGIVLSSPARPERRFHPLAPLLPFTRNRLVAEARFGPDTARLLDAADRADALVSRSRWRLYDRTASPHIEAALQEGGLQITSVPIEDTRWTYGLATPEANAFAAVRVQSQRNLGVAVATALIAMVLAVVAARRLWRPLSQVGDAARALASGDMERRIRMERRDEIGQLAGTFDSMAVALAHKDAELRRHAEALERRVDERTAELSGLLRAIPDLIYKVSADGRILEHVSAKDGERAVTPTVLVGRKLSDLLPPDVAAATLERVGAAIRGENVPPFEYRQVLRGREHHFEARVSVTGRDAVVILVRNITDRRRHEEYTRFLARAASSLSSSLDYGSTIDTLANLAVPFLADLCVVDLLEHGQLRLGSVAAANLKHDGTVVTARARFPIALASQHPVAVAIRGGATLLPTCSASDFEGHVQSEEHGKLIQSIAPTSLMVLPLVARGQTLGAMTFVSTDPSRHYSDQDLAVARELADRAGVAIDNSRLYRELQESNQLKDEFLSTVSHELRTPLNAVLGWTQILRRAMSNPDQTARALEAIERNARAQAQLVDDLLDTSRVVSGKLRIEFLRTDITEIIQSAVDSFGPLARARDVTLTLRSAPDLVPVTGDPARLQQVVGNLLSNALKFTPPGGRIDVVARRAGATIEVVVSDTGIGIAPEFLPFVFDRFRQGDSTTTRAHGGLGLGLAIARHLVGLHGGTVRAESAGESYGATFTVVLPVRKSSEFASATSRTGDLISPELTMVRVLVVDDQEEARTLLRTMLANAGAQVFEASSADEARQAIGEQRPDVLVSDIAMPREDGYELIRSIRQAEDAHDRPRLPAIAVTAYARGEDRDRAIAAGYDRHISKPVDPEALLRAVAAVAAHRSSA
jgi:signal transduction histidine kinase/CheY-like chemotaxis protein/HAMP domain-containing protein